MSTIISGVTLYSPVWQGGDSNGKWKFQARTTASTSQTNTTYTVTIGATYLHQMGEADVHGDGGWHSGATLRSSAYRRIVNNTTKPTVASGYLKIVNNVSSSDLYFDTASSYKKVGSGGTMVINKTHDTQTVYLSIFGYRSTTKGNFNGLAEGINTGANETASTSYALTIDPMDKYTITYNLNGGTSDVTSTSEFLDTDTTITNVPTKDNYTFKGWSTTNGGVIDYPIGSTYTSKTNITLYAIWEYNYGLEKGSITAQRTSDDSVNATITGTYNIVGNGANVGTVNAIYKRVSGTTDWGGAISCTISQGNNSKAGGTTSHAVSFSISNITNIDADKSYDIKVVVKDQHNNTIEMQSYISLAYFTIDFKQGGREISFGTPANDDLTSHPNGLFKCGMDANFLGNITKDGIDVATAVLNGVSNGNGQVIIGDLLIQWGSTGNLTPKGSSANYSVTKAITFSHSYKFVPTIITTPESAATTTEIRCTPSSMTVNGFTMNLIRSNTTATNCMWFAIGQKA